MARRVRKVKFKFQWTKELTFLLSGLLILIIATVILALPSKMDKFLEKWSAAELTKETKVREIKEDKLLAEISKADGTIFVFYGTPDSEDSVNKMKLVERYANQYELDATVYWLDATDVNSASEDTKKTKDFKDKIDAREQKLQDVDLLKISSFWVYENGKITIDSADKDDSAFEKLVNQAFGKYTSK